jgi:hypothetical protein
LATLVRPGKIDLTNLKFVSGGTRLDNCAFYPMMLFARADGAFVSQKISKLRLWNYGSNGRLDLISKLPFPVTKVFRIGP